MHYDEYIYILSAIDGCVVVVVAPPLGEMGNLSAR